MNIFDLNQALVRARDGAEIQVAAGEFQGPWVIDKPVRLVGMGTASVLWSGKGPVLKVRAPGVHLENLSIEVTDEQDGIALLIEGPAQAHQPILKNVRVLGNAEGLGAGRRWRLPSVIDLGRVSTGAIVKRTIGLDVSGPVSANPELIGLQIQVQERMDGGLALNLTLNGNDLTAGTLLDGKVEVEAAGLTSPIRLTGQVVANSSASAKPEAGGSVVDLITGGERRPTVPEIPIVTAARPSIPPQPSLPVSPPEEHLSWEESFLDRARMAVDAGNLDQAIEFLSQAIKLKPGAIKPRIELARLCEKRGSFDLAAEEWRQILTIEPHHFDARQQLIVCYNQLNRFDEAIALVEESLRDASWKDNSDLFRALAMAYYKTGRLNEALWALGRAQQLCSDPKQKARLAALKQIWEKESAKP